MGNHDTHHTRKWCADRNPRNLLSMCGFAATINTSRELECSALGKGLSAIAHRGPDRVTIKHFGLPWCHASVGMARLKIVDQHDLSVPFEFPELGVSLAFNGEVYNWRSLRSELSDGKPWSTSCDAEVVARAWREWGPRCLEHFNGMWSMLLIDQFEGVLFLARDRAGKKPLFWVTRGSRMYVASEAKALPCALNEAPCPDEAAFEFDCRQQTPFSDVQRLGHGQAMLLTQPQDVMSPQPYTWWKLPVADQLYTGHKQAAVDELTELIIDAVRLRVTADVPVALQLSGGLDSAIIYHAWKRVDSAGARAAKKYCMDFTEDGIDNLSSARCVAPDTRRVTLTALELRDLLPRVVYHLDTPATWSAVCLWQLAERIARDGHKIVLSGEGADELFGGYARYRALYWLGRMFTDPRLQAYGPTIGHILRGEEDTILVRLLNRGGAAAEAHVLDIIRELAPSGSLVRRAMRVEFSTTMQVLLRMGDRMASAWSLENRCPLLDYRIINLAATLPLHWLITKSESKHILREVARALDVPRTIIDEKAKKGLAVPWSRWAPDLGVPSVGGSRGAWDRSGFATMMKKTWREACLRGPRLCPECPDA